MQINVIISYSVSWKKIRLVVPICIMQHIKMITLQECLPALRVYVNAHSSGVLESDVKMQETI